MVKLFRWLAARTSTLVEVTHAPELAFTRNLEGPSYVVPLCFLGLGFVLLAFLQAPLSLQWVQRQMQAAGSPPAQVADGIAMMSRSLGWGAAVVPLLLFIKWLLFAAILWLTSQLFLADLGFSRVLSIVAYSYPPILLRDVVILFILWMQGEAAFNRPDTMNAAIGLNLLLPQLRLPWSMLAGNINLFEIWYVILLTLGISKVAGTRWRKALALTLPNWLFALLLQFGLVSLGLSVRASLSR